MDSRLSGGMPGPSILHRHARESMMPSARVMVTVPPFGTERNGIVDQVAEHLAQPFVAAHDLGAGGQFVGERHGHVLPRIP